MRRLAISPSPGLVRSAVVLAVVGLLLCGAVPYVGGTSRLYLAYLVVGRDDGPGGVTQAQRAVHAAGGLVGQVYPQIGTVLAYGSAADFGARVRAQDGVAAAGASRTVPTGAPHTDDTNPAALSIAVDAARPGRDDAPSADASGPGTGRAGTRAAARTGGARPAGRPQRGGASADVPGELPGDDVPAAADPAGRAQWNQDMLGERRGSPVPPAQLRNTVVAVLDSGVDDTHPDLRGVVDPARSASCATGSPDTRPGAWRPDPTLSESGHGTHVSGIIGADRAAGQPTAKGGQPGPGGAGPSGVRPSGQGPSGAAPAGSGRSGADAASAPVQGVAGVAPGVRIAAVRLLSANGQYYGENLVCGFLWAADHGARVINNSYFADPWKYNCPQDPGQAAVAAAVGRAVAYAQRKGAVVVASAGNDAQDLSRPRTDDRSPNDRVDGPPKVRHLGTECIRLPGGLPGVLDVTALDADGSLAGYSNWGSGQVELAAPGGDPDGGPGQAVVSDWPGGGYASLAGTSMAAANVSGVAALEAALHPGASSAELARLLETGAVPLDCPDHDPVHGGSGCPGGAYYGYGLAVAPH